MKPYLTYCLALLTFVFANVVTANEAPVSPPSGWDSDMAEKALKTADDLWLKGTPARAAVLYEELLAKLPEDGKPFRSLIIMRLAQSHFAAGEMSKSLQALKLLDAFEYVPEHHALAAKELKAVIETGKNPGHARTPIPPLPKAQTTVEVSPAGTFPTLTAALAEARKVRKAGETVEILLAPGTYPQRETLKLGKADSGLVIRSKDSQNPAVITGGVNLRTWKKVTEPEALARLPEAVRDQVRVCDLASHGIEALGELVFGGFSSRRGGPKDNNRFKSFPVPELFYNGKAQTMAQWPNDGMVKLPINMVPKEPSPRFARWAGETDLWLHGYWRWPWADAYEKFAGIDASGNISLVPPTNYYDFRERLGRAVNALCELDEPGEWHLDTKKGLVHYFPPKDFDSGKCVLSSFETVIAADNCADLQVRDIKVNYVRGNALSFKNCSRLLIAGIDIQHCSGLGLSVLGGEKSLIHSCRINSMGKGGIDFLGGNWQKLIPCHSIIENCRISELSRIDRTYTPALLLEGMGITVRHNSFTTIPSSAIRVEACDALIELNYFHKCVYESGDQGAIDMWSNPLYRGNIIRWNDFDRIINDDSYFGAAAVRHDDYISGFMVSENIFRKGSKANPEVVKRFGAVQFNQGTDNYVEGNIFIDWHKAASGRSERRKWAKRVQKSFSWRKVMTKTAWQSEAWQRKYPMVRDLLNGADNQNFIADNQRFGSGSWGTVGYGLWFGNRDGDAGFHGETLKSVKSVLVPWHPIPVDLIGPYGSADEGR